MGLFSKDIKTMDDLFVHTLQDIYYAEKQLLKALPKMARKAAARSIRRPWNARNCSVSSMRGARRILAPYSMRCSAPAKASRT